MLPEDTGAFSGHGTRGFRRSFVLVQLNVGAPDGLASGGLWVAFWKPVAQILPKSV